MRRIAIVPMKPLARAKARLAPVLTPAQRRALSLAMLEDVVRAATCLDAVWVLNSDPDAAAVARAAGGEPCPDPTPGGGLNASLDAATTAAVEAGATGVLILSADCPAVSGEDVEEIARGAGVAIAPDRAGEGTNALWREPPDTISAAFGEGSRAAHERLARARGLSVRAVVRPGLAVDVDHPEDLDDAARVGGAATRAALATLGYSQPGRR